MGSEMCIRDRRKQALTSLQGLKLDNALRTAASNGELLAGFQPEEVDPSSPNGFFVRLPDDGVPIDALKVKFADTIEDAQEISSSLSEVPTENSSDS